MKRTLLWMCAAVLVLAGIVWVSTEPPLSPASVLAQTSAPTSSPCGAVAAPSTVPPPGTDGLYQGPFFDTHIHHNQQQQLLPTGESLCRYLEEERTYWAIFFAGFAASNVTANTFRYIGDIRPRIIPLLQTGGPPHTEFIQGAFTEDFLRRFTVPHGPYSGFGEFGLYFAENASIRYTGTQFRSIFQVANETRGMVMIHPKDGTGGSSPSSPQDIADLEAMLQTYPNVVFLLHSGRYEFSDQSVVPLISRYPNLYFTYDTNHMLRGSWGSLGAPSGTVQEFVDSVNRVGLNRIIDENLTRTRTWFQQYPDRIMWGTDRSQLATFDRAGRDLLLQLSRTFVGRLPAATQEAFAFRNAMRVFGRYFSNPAHLAQFATGAGWISSLVLTNPSTTETATGSFSFFDDRGQLFSISLNGAPAASTTSFTINPLGSVVFYYVRDGRSDFGFSAGPFQRRTQYGRALRASESGNCRGRGQQATK